MKVLIWCGCFFASALIQGAITVNGIMLGAIPTMIFFSATWWAARTLCKKWDEYRYEKEREKSLKDYKAPTPPPGAMIFSEEPSVPAPEPELPKPVQIKFCRKCGFELLEGSEFCSKCGTPIVKE